MRDMNSSQPEPSGTPGDPPPKPPRIAVITCAVLEIEFNQLARGLDHVIRIEVLEQGLHQDPDKLRRELQVAIDRVEASTDAEAIVLGYGICSRGSEGVRTRR